VKFFRVRNFEKFQHYKDRNPPWIKLYRSILDDPRFFRLSESERFLLLGIFILASQNDNRLPADQAWLKAKLLTKKAVPIDVLIASEWLEWIAESASTDASKHASKSASSGASTFASLRALAREETEAETEKRQKQRQKTEKSPLPQIPQTQTVTRSIEAGERLKDNDPKDPEFRKRVWAPIEAEIRKGVEPESFAKFYEGIEIREFTGASVILAVPEALIEKWGGCDSTASYLTKYIQSKRFELLRTRRLVVCVLEAVEA